MGANGKRPVAKVAVIAHAEKTFGGGLLELRRELARQGVENPRWREVSKSKEAPAKVKRALAAGAELIFVWGGDGTVQQCIDVVAGTAAALAVLPAGTANLFATNLGIPQDIEEAVAIGLHGARRKLDVGRVNGERFGVMAGAGFDAAMIREADGGLKDRFGRAAYVWTGSKNLRAKPFNAKIAVDGTSWYSGEASCILVGNMGRLFAGIEVFEDARPDDGRLEIGVVNADGITDWVAHADAHGARPCRPLAARPRHERAEDRGRARPPGAVRARRRRSAEGQVLEGQGRAAGGHRLRSTGGDVMSVHHDTAVARGQARRAGQSFVNSRAFAILSRAGFVARGLVYGIIGLLALDLALGRGGKITNQQGALHSVEQQPFGHVLLASLAVGLGGYSLWRLFRAVLGHGPEGADRGFDRLGALGSGIAYGLMCALAVQILATSSGGGSATPKQTANDVFGWPAGRWLVGAAGLVMLGVALYQFVRGARQKFLDDSHTEKMSPGVRKWFTTVGTIGHLARAVVFGSRRRVPRQGRDRLPRERGDRPRWCSREDLQRRVRSLAARRGRRGTRRVCRFLDHGGPLSTDLGGRFDRAMGPPGLEPGTDGL